MSTVGTTFTLSTVTGCESKQGSRALEDGGKGLSQCKSFRDFPTPEIQERAKSFQKGMVKNEYRLFVCVGGRLTRVK